MTTKIAVVDTGDDAWALDFDDDEITVGDDYECYLIRPDKNIAGEIVLTVTVKNEISYDDLEDIADSYKNGCLSSIEGGKL